MYILGIDSSAERLSIAVNKDQQLLSKVTYDKNQKFMTGIIFLIDKALKKSGLDMDLIDLYAVNIGPGDFTGTRIGISVAKTLAWAKNRPIYGIGSLDITALDIFFRNFRKIRKFLEKGNPIIIVPVLDVKRDELFFSFFKIEDSTGSNNYFINKFSDSYLIESGNFIKKFNDLIVSCGNPNPYVLMGGSGFDYNKHDAINNCDSGNNIILDKRIFYPDAFYLNLCAYHRYLKNGQENPEKDNYGPAPLYVREFTPFKK